MKLANSLSEKEGDFTLQNIIPMYGKNRLIENLLKYVPLALSRIFNEMEFNNPLYYLTLPGFVLGAGGVYMGLNFAQTLYFNETPEFESTAFMVLFSFVGFFMAFTGILLHSVTGLIRYKMSSHELSLNS